MTAPDRVSALAFPLADAPPRCTPLYERHTTSLVFDDRPLHTPVRRPWHQRQPVARVAFSMPLEQG
jgi:hypothetical protein